MVAPKLYLSSDASAPVLNGTNGSMINVLDACLVNGYGSRAAAGWAKSFSGTNKAVYRMGVGGSAERAYLRVSDAGTGNQCFLKSYRTMTDVDTGSYECPEIRLITNPNGAIIYKSSSSDSVARPWAIVATATAFWFVLEMNSTYLGQIVAGVSNSGTSSFFFGEYKKYYTSHDNNVALMGSHNQGSASWSQGVVGGKKLRSGGPSITATDNLWIMRAPYGFDQPLPIVRTALGYSAFASPLSADYEAFGAGGPGGTPSTIDGKFRISKIELVVASPSWELIGELPGSFHALNSSYLSGNAIVEGLGDYAGQQFLCSSTGTSQGASTSYYAQVLINLTDWQV